MLANVGSGKWELADFQSPPSSADLIFRVAGTGSPSHPQAALVLLDGERDGVIWSREFGQTNVTEADLRLQLSLTAGQVLGCALEAHDAGGVRPDLLKLFLVGCAEQAESSEWEPHRGGRIMRAIVDRQPRFKPAWTRLLLADYQGGGAPLNEAERAEAEAILLEDIGKAQRFVPDLPLLKVIEGEVTPLSPFDYAGRIERMERATSIIPDMAPLWLDQAVALAGVGRMSDAVKSTRRAVQLDPLSPDTRSRLIAYLAWSGRIELAREELRKAERQWPGTGALRDAQWAFHLRYGDLKFAATLQLFSLSDAYVRARLEPTPANVNLLMEDIQRPLSRSDFSKFGQAIQALGEFDKTEEIFAWLDRAPRLTAAEHFYLLFRPALADVRRDPRFMAAAKRFGLLSYWQKSGEWPDFCSEPGLPYDCKKEAAKLAA
jgi:tetratricopeptide (TPR) repeat protein